MYTDSHCHLSFLNEDQALAVVQSGREKGLSRWLMAGYDPADWERQAQLQKRVEKGLYTAFGIHPWVVIERSATELTNYLESLKAKIQMTSVVGEMGLDFQHPEGRGCALLQEEYFRKQLQISESRACVLHVVKAHGRALEILGEFPESRGWVHGFSGSWEVAQTYIRKGFLISVGRNVLKENFKNLQEVLQKIELKDLMLESDAPNSPEISEDPVKIIFQVAEHVARKRNVSVDELLQICHQNTSRLLGE